MKLSHLIAVSTAALAVGLASPGLAQNTNDNTNTNTNNTQNNSTSSSAGYATAASSATASSDGVTTTTDNSQDNDGNGNTDNSQDNDHNGNTFTDSSQDNDGSGNTGSGNGNGDGAGNGNSGSGNGNGSQNNSSQDNDFNGNSYSDASQDNDFNGNTLTDSSHSNNDYNSVDDGSVGASQGGEVDTVASGDGSIAVSRGGEVEIGNTEDVGNVYDSNNQNNSIIAEQDMRAIISNDGGMEAVVDDTNQGYRSGDNSVRGNAFAAFAGILNQAWNTGVNSNTQSGTNIAAGATINFGDAAGGAGVQRERGQAQAGLAHGEGGAG